MGVELLTLGDPLHPANKAIVNTITRRTNESRFITNLQISYKILFYIILKSICEIFVRISLEKVKKQNPNLREII